VSKKAKGDDKDEQAKAMREEGQGTQAPATPLPSEEQDLDADSIKHDRKVKEGQDRVVEADPSQPEAAPGEAQGGEGNPKPQEGPMTTMGASGAEASPKGDGAPRVKLSMLNGLREHLEGLIERGRAIKERAEEGDFGGKLARAIEAAQDLRQVIREVMERRGVSAPVPEEGGPAEGVQPADKQPAG
jgi:hypothetical protein